MSPLHDLEALIRRRTAPCMSWKTFLGEDSFTRWFVGNAENMVLGDYVRVKGDSYPISWMALRNTGSWVRCRQDGG
jgi:hypothetical protein